MICFRLLIILGSMFVGGRAIYAQDSHTQNIVKQHQIEQEGVWLVKNGQYDEAIVKFKEAMQPEYIKYENDKGMPTYYLIKVLILQEKYDEALKENQWYVNRNKTNNTAIIAAKEIEALRDYKKTGNPQIIRDYIPLLKAEYKQILPPIGYDSGIGPTQIATILRLCDTIGDQDAGLKFIDEVLNFLRDRKKNRGDAYDVYDRIKTVEQATNCMKVDPKDNPDWHGCKFLRAYLLVREAFEKDKAEGTKGRATKALIQSDYFPW